MSSNENVEPFESRGRQESVDLEAIAARLDNLSERLASIEESVDRVEQLGDQVPQMAAMFTDIVDRWSRRADGDGVDVDRRVQGLALLLYKLTDPEVLEGLQMLAERGGRLKEGIKALEQLPGMVAMATDTFDRVLLRLEDEGIRPDEIGHSIAEASVYVAKFVQAEGFNTLMKSGVLDPRAVTVIGQLGDALADTTTERTGTTGLFGLMGAIRRPEIRRALDFVVRFGENFGSSLKNGVKKVRGELPE